MCVTKKRYIVNGYLQTLKSVLSVIFVVEYLKRYIYCIYLFANLVHQEIKFLVSLSRRIP